MVNEKNKGNTPKDITGNNSPKNTNLSGKERGRYFLTSSKEEELFNDLKLKQIQIDVQKQEIRQLENHLKNSKEKYTRIYDFSPSGYLTLDDNGLIIEANLTASRIFGIEKSSLIKMPFYNFLILKETKRFTDFLRNCRKHDCHQVGDFSITALPVIIYPVHTALDQPI